MNRLKFPAATLRLALAFACALAPAVSAGTPTQGGARPAPPPKPSTVFQEAKPTDGRGTPGAFEFEMNGYAYHVRANGNGRRVRGRKVRGFNLRLDAGEQIGSLFYTDYEGDLLLLLHVGDGGGVAGVVTRLEQPSMRGLWLQRVEAPDVGEPLREGHHLYLTGKSFVAKLDLRTGEYEWGHSDLADARAGEPRPLGAFDPPELKGDAVLFRERPVYNPRRTVVVDRKTGQVIRIE